MPAVLLNQSRSQPCTERLARNFSIAAERTRGRSQREHPLNRMEQTIVPEHAAKRIFNRPLPSKSFENVCLVSQLHDAAAVAR